MKSLKFPLFAMVAVAILSVDLTVYAQQHAQHESKQQVDKATATCPMHESASKASETASQHDSHLAAVNERGEKAMGFSQSKTQHHFILMSDGGAIQVEAVDPQDATNRDLIRKHLTHIAQLFSKADFNIPMLVHGEMPPGVPTMGLLKSEITYTYKETANGAMVRISTGRAKALAAIHEFLRFQITDHQTGDSLNVVNKLP